jgi:hypothetical protein
MASKRKVTPDQEVNNASPLPSEDNTLANHSSIDISSIRTSISMTPNYIPQNLIISLRNDAINLHKKGLFSSGGTGGRSGKQINNQNSRQCDIVVLFDDDVMDLESEAREDIFDVMGELKEYLSVGLGVELDDSMDELQYLGTKEIMKEIVIHENERRGSSTIGMRRSLLDGECTMNNIRHGSSLDLL